MLRATYLEVQFSQQSILELVRTSLVTNYPPNNPLLPPTGVVLPPAEDGTQFVVISTAFVTGPGGTVAHHGADYMFSFEWSDMSEHFEDVPARRCVVTQRVRLDVVRRETRADGQLQDIEVGIVEGTLFVDLTAYAVENVAQFFVETRRFTVDTADIDPRLLKVFQRYGLGNYLRVQVPLRWRVLVGEATPPRRPGYNPDLTTPDVQNCGAAFTADLSAFAVRIQFGGAPSRGLQWEWTDFHAGNFPNRLHRPDGTTAQWGVLLSPALVESLTREQIEESLARQDDNFRLIGGVGAQWAPDGSVPRVQGSFDGTVLIVCRPQYHVTFNGRIEVTAPNILVTTTDVNWHGDTLDLALCEGEAALGGGVAGAAFGVGVGGPLGAPIGFVLGLGTGFIGGMIAATVYNPDLATDSCTQDGSTLTCTRVLDPSIQVGGQPLPFNLTSAAATEDGLVMTGTYQLPLIPALTQSQVLIETKPFAYTALPVNCSNLSFGFLVATTDDVASFTHSEATITVRWVDDDGRERTPLPLTVTLVSADTQNVFPPSSVLVVPFSNRTVIYVRPAVSQTAPPKYWDAPYGCTLLVSMVIATRTVAIPAPSRLSAAEKAKLHEHAQKMLSDCLAKQVDTGKDGGRTELEWLPDPNPDGLQSSHLWQIGVLGLEVGEQVHAEDRQGQLLVSARASAEGSTRMTILMPGGAKHRQLFLRRSGEATNEATASRTDTRLRQTELIPHGTLQPGGRLRSVSTKVLNGRLIAALASTTNLTVYDVTFPNAIRGYLRYDAAGIDGMTLFEGGLAFWGVQGLKIWAFDRTAPRRIIDASVKAVRAARTGLLVMTDEHILVVSRDGVRAARLASRKTGTSCELEAAFDSDEIGARKLAHASVSDASYALAANTLEYHVIGSTMLVMTADGDALNVFSVGRSVDA